MNDNEVNAQVIKWVTALENMIKRYKKQLINTNKYDIEKLYLVDLKCQLTYEILKDMKEPNFLDKIDDAVEYFNSRCVGESDG